MCQECGCGIKHETALDGPGGQNLNATASAGPGAVSREQAPVPPHGAHDHPREHDHPHESSFSHDQGPAGHTVVINEPILAENDRLAERNRGFFQAKRLLVLNVLSSPGSGKTTLVQKTIEQLKPRLRLGVVVGDLATDRDATRLRATGAPVVQITTGTVCHLDADMVSRAMGKLDLDRLDMLVIENVGNLVCPAAYDLGENLRVVVLSVTEGEDKPLKYPPLFHSAQVAIISKMDLAEAAGFDRAQALANVQRISHHARIFEVAAKTGLGMEAWCEFLVQEHRNLIK